MQMLRDSIATFKSHFALVLLVPSLSLSLVTVISWQFSLWEVSESTEKPINLSHLVLKQSDDGGEWRRSKAARARSTRQPLPNLTQVYSLPFFLPGDSSWCTSRAHEVSQSWIESIKPLTVIIIFRKCFCSRRNYLAWGDASSHLASVLRFSGKMKFVTLELGSGVLDSALTINSMPATVRSQDYCVLLRVL